MSSDEKRIREFAYQIWESEGRPEGQESRHWEMASKLAEAEALVPKKPTATKPAAKPRAASAAKPAAAPKVAIKPATTAKPAAEKKPRAPRKPAAS